MFKEELHVRSLAFKLATAAVQKWKNRFEGSFTYLLYYSIHYNMPIICKHKRDEERAK